MKSKFLFLLVGFASGLLFSGQNTALADVAPPPPAAGSDIGPSNGTTMVRMVSETVLLDITPQEETTVAYVTANFFMQNMGETTEQMTARFPMNSSDWNLEMEVESGIEACQYSPAPPITDFSVRIYGISVDSVMTYETFLDHINSGPENGDVYVTLPCWAHFEVTFPPGAVVEVEIKYVQAGYDSNGGGGGVEFAYVIGTGAGWFGTIGSAEITARLPYPANDLNIKGCFLEDCIVSGTDVRYSYEDFEPVGNLNFHIVKPTIWTRVLAETQAVANNPSDGEAWGRLGKAYKEILEAGKGFLSVYTEKDETIFEESRAAYGKAIDLLPSDIDWHFGYADLLCRKGGDVNADIEDLKACLAELQVVIDAKPDHEGLDNLFWFLNVVWYGSDNPIVDLSGPEPVFLILTPQPTPTGTKIPPTPPTFATEVAISPTETPASTDAPTRTEAPTATAKQPSPTDSQKPEPPDSADSPAGLFVAAGILVLVGLGFMMLRRKP